MPRGTRSLRTLFFSSPARCGSVPRWKEAEARRREGRRGFVALEHQRLIAGRRPGQLLLSQRTHSSFTLRSLHFSPLEEFSGSVTSRSGEWAQSADTRECKFHVFPAWPRAMHVQLRDTPHAIVHFAHFNWHVENQPVPTTQSFSDFFPSRGHEPGQNLSDRSLFPSILSSIPIFCGRPGFARSLTWTLPAY